MQAQTQPLTVAVLCVAPGLPHLHMLISTVWLKDEMSPHEKANTVQHQQELADEGLSLL